MAVLVGLVTLGGIQRVSKFASFIVPIKAFLYLSAAFLIILWHIDQLIPALKLMFTAAFTGNSMVGGVLGFGVVKALTTGFDRGIFATDAGTGIVPILQASARTSIPVVDGIVTLVAPFLVMIVCTTTGLVLIVTGAWQQMDLRSTNMVTHAFEKGLGSAFGSYIVIIALILFAYTTVLAWACCGEKAMGFLMGNRQAPWFKYLFITLIPVGSLIHVDLIWILADISISLMLVTNIVGVMGLSQEVIGESRQYFLETPEDYLIQA
jgi:AGCS family alanine or glycine:cation symporter